MDNYFNPYSHQTFFSFLFLFFTRLFQFFSGSLTFQDLSTDEIQIFVLSGVAASCALVGSFLVLRKMTMLANALSHTILLGIVIAYLLMMTLGNLSNPQAALSISTFLIASIVTGVITTFLTEVLHRSIKLQEDASIGLVFTTLFAAAILLVTLFTRNVHVGTELVMGNVDALQKGDLKIVYLVFLLNAVVFLLFFKGFKITTFDPGLARALGFSPLLFNYILMILTSATSIGAFRAVGVLMVLAFFVIPPLIARLLTDRLIVLIGLAFLIGTLCAVGGVALSRHLLTVYQTGLSTAGIVVCLLVVCYLLTIFFAPKKGLVALFIQRKIIKNSIVLRSDNE